MRNKGTTGRSGGRRNTASIRKNDLNKGKPGYNRTPAGENKNRPKKGERTGSAESGKSKFSGEERSSRPYSGPASDSNRSTRPGDRNEGRFNKDRKETGRPSGGRPFSNRPDSRSSRPEGDREQSDRRFSKDKGSEERGSRPYSERSTGPRGPRPNRDEPRGYVKGKGGSDRPDKKSDYGNSDKRENTGYAGKERSGGSRPQGRPGGDSQDRGKRPYTKSAEGSGRFEKRPYEKRTDDNSDSRRSSSEHKEGSYFKSRSSYKGKSEPEFKKDRYEDERNTSNTETNFKQSEFNPEQDGNQSGEKEVVKPKRKYSNERNDKGRYSRHKEFDDKAKVEREDRKKAIKEIKEELQDEDEIPAPPAKVPFVKGEFSKNKRVELAKGESRNFSSERDKRDDGRAVRPRTTKTAYSKNSKEDKRVRLNKFISNSGICSRREADEMIAAGVVSVNGIVITELGYKAYPTDEIRYNGEIIKTERPVYVLLNKPKDFITTTDDPEERRTVMALVENACKERIYPVGRLDRATTGLLLFTNDGDLTKKLTHPSGRIKKIYHVELDKTLKSADMNKISEGVELEDGLTVVDAISYVGDDKKQVGVELHSGKNRVVRRIFESLGYKVLKLDRVYFAGLTKKDLTRGKWRFLSDMELNMLRML
jgi:23S rRNA pseudouridine2605 synthase